MTAALILESPAAWTQEPDALQALADRAVEAAFHVGLEAFRTPETTPDATTDATPGATPGRTAAPDDPAPALAIALIDDARMTALNAEFRDQTKPTNVLSWPNYDGASPEAVIPAGLADGPARYWGDLALAGETVIREATAEKKAFAAHFSHLIIHGVLHLLGHDHIEDDQAERMEALETLALNSLGYPDPYGDHEDAA